ncbi:MAG: hypothetical protein IT460_00790 [Planctomycetes bacterium]|nr:hypothetical protein [Planctomycetota bacterium]
MAKLSERQRLWLTIGASVALSGGVVAMTLMDRKEIERTEEEIAALDVRIASADAEIAKTKDREDEVIVFRAVKDRELEILPRHQEIAEFHANLTTFLTQAGARFTKLPENAPKESELARGVFVTPNGLEFEADAAALLRLVNMIEIDPRLVAVKGLKIKGGGRGKEGEEAPLHKASLALETYYYNPQAETKQPVAIPGEAERREDPVIAGRITAFQPEKRDSYTLRPATSRRDPFVDVRREVIEEDPEVVKKRFEAEQGIVADLETRLEAVREKVEQEKAFVLDHRIFEADRISREIDGQVNELRVRLASTSSLKSVSFPDLLARGDRVRTSMESIAAARKDVPRDLRVVASVAREVRGQVDGLFRSGDYAGVNSLCVAWEAFVRGKEVEPAALPILDEIKDYRRRAKVLSEFHAKSVHVTGVMVTSDASTSAALVNGRVVRTGEALDAKGDLKVAAIRREGVEFSYQGESVFVLREDAGGDKAGARGDAAVPVHTPQNR